ncbi:MAG: STAS domain-containing protein [Candidatus Gracilibacteria bacterium]|jgi:anti-anti-sigma factor
MPTTLSISELPVDAGNNYKVIKFAGAFDKSGYSDINSQLDSILSTFAEMDSTSMRTIVFDFTDLDYINSQGIGIIMEIHNDLKDHSKKLVIIGVKPNVQDVFTAIGMNELVQVYATLKDYQENN